MQTGWNRFVPENGDAYFLCQRKEESADVRYGRHVLKYNRENDSYAVVELNIPGVPMERIIVSPGERIALMGSGSVWLYRSEEAQEEYPVFVPDAADYNAIYIPQIKGLK